MIEFSEMVKSEAAFADKVNEAFLAFAELRQHNANAPSWYAISSFILDMDRVSKRAAALWPEMPGSLKRDFRHAVDSYRRLEEALKIIGLREVLVGALLSPKFPLAVLAIRKSRKFVRRLSPLIEADDQAAQEHWNAVARQNPELVGQLRRDSNNYDPAKTVKRDLEKTPRHTA